MAQPRLEPPIRDAPIADDQFSKPWVAYNQTVADRIQALPDQLTTGVTDGSDAAAGKIGEYMTATSGTVALSNSVAANIASLDLTAGDWDVSGNVVFSAGSGTHTYFGAGIAGLDTVFQATFPSTALTPAISTATHRFNLTATTTVWVVGQAGFTGAVDASGTIRARRVR